MTSETASCDVMIANRRGLHARASARFANEAGTFDARIEVSKEGTSVLGTSIMGLMMLGAAKGEAINIGAEGPEAQLAVDKLRALVENLFGEDE